jgi:elongation factor G
LLGAAQTGALGGYALVDLKITLIGGSAHAKDSNELAFEIAANLAFQSALAQAGPVLLEPVMLVECLTPSEFQGDIAGDLQRRRGVVRGVETKAGLVVVTAEVPLAEMFGYATAIRSLSKGRAAYSMEPFRFEPVPNSITEKILDTAKPRPAARS